MRRSAGVVRSRRGRMTGRGTAPGPRSSPARSSRRGAPCGVEGLRSDGLVTGWPASTIAARRAAPKSASASTSTSTSGLRRQHVDPQAVLLGGLGRRRADHRDDRRRVRLAGDADQVAHRRGRGEHDRVELAGLDRVADRRRRRGRPHGAVRRDVVALPAEVDQAGDEVLGGDVGARQEDPVDRVEQLVVLRPVLEQAGGGLLAATGPGRRAGPSRRWPRRSCRRPRRSSGRRRHGRRGRTPRTSRGRPDRVDRGEGDPLVAALDQAADGLVHLQRVARRLDRDGRHLLGHARRSSRRPRGQRAGLLLGAGHQDPPAEQRLGLEPRQRLAQRRRPRRPR